MTLVLLPPITVPSGSRLGWPFLRIPMSVVVPPMSMTTASFTPVMLMAPMRLAAGPDRMVSTGLSLANESFIMLPSPRDIMSGAAMPFSSRTERTERISSSMTGMSLAFMTQVVVRSLKPSSDDSSNPQTAGTPRISLAMSLTLISCSGFLTLMKLEIAIPSTFPLMDSRNSLAAASSRY